MEQEKIVRILVTCMVEFKTTLPIDEAIKEFEENSMYNYEDTDNVTILQTEWRETQRISYVQHNKTNTQILLKPLK